ncbi:hypothetical protein SAMN05443639_1264 [Stigmatella erecta]|uniref:Uncharacterized protein n=2 Tax=Stigmatella erecta TaxID=83460 RepID=A0A1I0LDL2_9BACT|nr:hypothetical protein SAMN05443639_1264 [Stigmatella erecta]
MLRSAKGRADRSPRLDQCLDVNRFNLREAWKIGTLLLPPEEAPLSRHLRVELVAVHPQATLPIGRKFGPKSLGRHLLENIDSVDYKEQRIYTRLERFGAGAALDPSSFGHEAQEEAGCIVFLATIPERKEYHADLTLFFHPSWLEKPKRPSGWYVKNFGCNGSCGS